MQNYEIQKRRRGEGKQKEWQQANKDKIKSYREKRKDKDFKLSSSEWQACKKYFGYSCSYCGMSDDEHKELYGQQLHRDHFESDGENDISNCVPGCISCNSSKKKHSFYDWYVKEKYFFSETRYRKIISWIDYDHANT
ncbi:HNH endonuclease [Paenibacillus sp. LK1]|uniref:HNH endonuclease n=1 Tax=Paenibacillus sp. LK1 TaxID=2053014 RepID=UPI000F738482|nr:HNH endonuclease [Paenibacillus sp. LK1]